MKTSQRTYTKFHLRLFWSVISVLLLICLFFAGFQYFRERQYRIELLRAQLSYHADEIYEELKHDVPVENLKAGYHFRISVIDLSGNVLYDSEVADVYNIENHSTRKEVLQAMQKGSGYELHRRSVLTGEVYFYSAKKYDTCIIRLCVPYDSELVANLKITSLYIFVTVILLLIFIIIYYNEMRHLGKNINRLNDFVTKAEREETDDFTREDLDDFPGHFSNDEVGDISRHVVQIYNRLQKTKQALVTEQQRVLKQQEEQDRIKRQLTHNVAHELKTPVSSIQGYLETIINNRDITPEIMEKFIERCYQQSTRLSSLLHDISTLARMDEASELILKEQVDLSKLIVDILDDAAATLKEKNITVYNETEALSLICEGNQSLLYSVFRNLVDNTIAYAGENIDVHIECNTEDPVFYYFSYSDNGVGIPQEHLERIFERFYRIDKGRSRKVGGTGLGLSIVKNAILLHGGTVTAIQRPGGGLAFVFSIKR
jgi:signal transduction histidine kinase